MFQQDQLNVYFIMGSNNCDGDPLHVLEKALKGGITMFQFREKGNGAKKGSEKHALAKQMQALCKEYGVPFIINDDVSLAIEIEADGIHVGQDDTSVKEIKRMTPKHFIVGVSATNEEEARQGVKDEADYIGVGPVFATNSKADAKTPIGMEGVARISKVTDQTPIVAIGGISRTDASAIIKAGASGVAVISAISQASLPENEAYELKRMVKAARGS